MNMSSNENYFRLYNDFLSKLDYSSEKKLKENINNLKNEKIVDTLKSFLKKSSTTISGFDNEVESEEQVPEGKLKEYKNIKDISGMNINKKFRDIIREKTKKKINLRNKYQKYLKENLNKALISLESSPHKTVVEGVEHKLLSATVFDHQVSFKYYTNWNKDNDDFWNQFKGKTVISSLEGMIKYFSDKDDVVLSKDFISELTKMINLMYLGKSNEEINTILKSLQK